MLKKHFLLLTSLIVGIVIASNVQAEDAFSALSRKPAPVAAERTTSQELREILDSLPKEEFKEISENLWVMKVKYKEFTLPTIVNRSPQGSVIWNTYRLAKVPSDIPADQLVSRLTKLMLANGAAGDFFFSLDDDMMIQLNGCIQVHGKLDPQEYIDHLIRMGEIVVDAESLWSPSMWNQDIPKHVGRWGTEDNSMTLNLNAAEQFELIVGQSTTNGKFALDGKKIAMTDSSGEKLEGDLIFDNANQFRLIVEGHSTTFTRL